MSDNPMNYSELFDFSDKSVINEALRDLAALKKAYTDFNQTVVQTQFKKIEEEQKQLADQAKKLAEETRKLNASQKDHQKTISSQAKEIQVLKQENENLKKSKIGVAEADRQVADSVNALSAKLKEQVAQYKALSASQDTAKQRELAKGIVETKTQIKQLTDAVRVNVNTMKFAKGSYQELEQVNRSLITQLKNMEGGMDGNSAAANNLKARIFENTQKLKEFDQEMNQNFRNVGNYSSAFSGLAGNLGLIPTQLKTVISSLGQLNSTTKESTEAQKRLEGQNANLTAQLLKMEGGMSNNSAEAQKLKKEIADNTKNLDNFNKTSAASVLKMGLIAGAMIALTVATKGFSQAMELTADFESSISNLAAITGAGAEDIKFYREEAMRLGETSIFSANQVADAYTIIGSKKPELLQNKEALAELTQQTLTLAEAAGIDLPAAGEAMTLVLNKFDADASQSARVADILASSFRLGSVDIQQTAQELSKFGGIANELDITMETSAAAIQVVGKTVEESGTKLRNVLLTLTKGAAEFNPEIVGFETALDNLGKKQMSVGELGVMFGTQNAEAALQLIKNREEVKSLALELENSGTALEMAGTRTDNWRGSVAGLSSAVQGATIRVFELVMKALRPMVEVLTALILGFKEVPKFIEENKEILMALGVAVISFNTQAIATNAILLKNIAVQKAQQIATIATTVAQRGLNAAMTANPIGLVITAAALLAAMFATLYKRSETFRAGISGLAAVAQEVFKIIKDIFADFTDGFGKILDGDLKGGMKSIAKGIINSNPTKIAQEQGKRLGKAFTDGYNKSIDESRKKDAKEAEFAVDGPKYKKPGSDDDAPAAGPTDKEIENARKQFERLSQLSAEYAIAELKLQKSKQEESIENERKFLEESYAITIASLDERIRLYSKDSEEYKQLQITKMNTITSFNEASKKLDERAIQQEENKQKEIQKIRDREIQIDSKRIEVRIQQERLLEAQKLNEIKLLQAQRKVDIQDVYDLQYSITSQAIQEEIALHQYSMDKLTEADLEYFDHKKAILQLEKALIDERTAYEIEKEKEAQMARQQLIEQSFALTSSLANSFNSIAGNGTEKRIQEMEREKNFAITAAGDNKEAQVKIEQDFNRKVAKEKQRAALRDKMSALFEVGLQTALGIQKAVAASPLTFGLPFSAFVAASGVAQAAAIISKPIPQYAKGRNDGPAEYAELNERGPELLEKNGIFRMFNKGKRGIGFLQKGEKVHTAEKSKIIEKSFLESKESDSYLNSLINGTKIVISHSEYEHEKLLNALVKNNLNEEILFSAFEKAVGKIPVTTHKYDSKGYSEFVRNKNLSIEKMNNRNKMGGLG
jgi:TP901 family phage tail tape measure protein